MAMPSGAGSCRIGTLQATLQLSALGLQCSVLYGDLSPAYIETYMQAYIQAWIHADMQTYIHPSIHPSVHPWLAPGDGQVDHRHPPAVAELRRPRGFGAFGGPYRGTWGD